MDDPIFGERHEARVMEHELIERHDLVVGILCHQIMFAHNRAVKARAVAEQRSEANLIARLTELYFNLM